MKVKDLISYLLLADPEYELRIGIGSESYLVDESETDYSSEIVTLWVKE